MKTLIRIALTLSTQQNLKQGDGFFSVGEEDGGGIFLKGNFKPTCYPAEEGITQGNT